MKEEHLPWESTPGAKYSARALKTRKQWVTICCWCMSGFLIVGGFCTPYRITILFGVLCILALLMKKDTVVTERGLEMYYQMRVTTHYDFWGWEQIRYVTREDRGHPELVALYFGFENRSRRLFFTKEDAKMILVLARKKNPRILVQDTDQKSPNKKNKL